MASSDTSPTSRAAPARSHSTSRIPLPDAFLSRRIRASRSPPSRPSGNDTGSPSRSSSRCKRSASASGAIPSRAESRAASTMPTATASPWFRPPPAPAYPCSVSMAWPKVWPKLSRARSPCSSGSRATTAALQAQECAIASASAVSSRASRRCAWTSSQSRNPISMIAPYLTTSASPARSSRSGRVRRVAVSAITARGGWKAPTRFLPAGRSTAVLPPTEESTIASRVVGNCTMSTPRIQHAAAKPARSPTTPPPSASTVASRVAPSPASASITSPNRDSVFSCSPGGSTKRATCSCGRAASSAASTPSAYSGATLPSLTSSTCRPRTCRARPSPSASKPGPASTA